jgi:hypothetical protein
MNYYFFQIDCCQSLSFNVVLECRYEIEEVLAKLNFKWFDVCANTCLYDDNDQFSLFKSVVFIIAKNHGCEVKECKKITG